VKDSRRAKCDLPREENQRSDTNSAQSGLLTSNTPGQATRHLPLKEHTCRFLNQPRSAQACESADHERGSCQELSGRQVHALFVIVAVHRVCHAIHVLIECRLCDVRATVTVSEHWGRQRNLCVVLHNVLQRRFRDA